MRSRGRPADAGGIAMELGHLPLPRCVLVIEDDPFIRDLYEILLSDGGYRVETAINGQDGLDRLWCAPDLIVLDLMMPVMDGREFLGRLRGRADGQRTPVLLVTAIWGPSLPGAQGVLQKPFESEALLGRVAALLEAAA
jgi:CheY-like chemotaxis protein